MAKRSITSDPPGDGNLNIFLQRYTDVVQFLRDKKGSLTAVPFGLQYFEAFESLEPFLGKLNVVITEHDANIADLEALLNEAKALLERLGQLDLENLDPEKIRSKVLEALAAWKNEVDRLIGGLQELTLKHGEQIAAIDAGLKAIDPAKIEQNAVTKVLEELASWREEVHVALTKLQEFANMQEPLVRQLRMDVDTLMAKINGVDFSKFTPEAINRAVLDAVQDWKNDIQAQIGRLTADIATLRNELSAWKASTELKLEQLKQRIDAHDTLIDQANKRATAQDSRIDQLSQRTDAHDTLFGQLSKRIDAIVASGGGDPEKVKELVLKALEAWRKAIDDSLASIKTDLGNHGAQLFDHDQWIKTLQTQVREILDKGTVDPAAIKAAVLEALKGWQSLLQQQLDDLKKRQEGDDSRWIGHQKSLEQINERITALAGTIPNVDGLKAEMFAIRDALKGDINTKTQALTDRLSQNILRIDAEIRRLDERINGIETTGVDPEEVRKIIEKELVNWRQEVQTSINQLTADLIHANTRIDVAVQRIEKLENEGLTEQKVKEILEALLLDFKTENQRALQLVTEKITGVNTRLTDWIAEFGKRLTTVEGLLPNLAEEIRLLKERGIDEAGIKIIVEGWIKQWQEAIALDIANLKETDRLTGIAIGNLDQAIKNLEIRINNIVISVTPEDVKKQVEAALESWQKILQNHLKDLRKAFEDELKDLINLKEQIRLLNLRIASAEGKDWTAEVLKALESWKKDMEDSVAAANSLAADALSKIEALTLEDGLIMRISGQLEILRLKVNTLPDEARVKQLIEEANQWLQTWKEAVDKHLQAYIQDKQKLENRITALDGEMTKADREIRSLIGAQKKAVESELQKQEDRIAKVEERVNRDDRDDQAFAKATNLTLDALKAKDSQIEGVNAAQQTEIDALKAKDSQIESVNAAQQTEIDALKTKDIQLDGVNAAQQTEIDALKAKDIQLDGVNAAQQAQIEALTAKDKQIEGVNAAQQVQIEALKAKDIQIEGANNAQQAQIEALKAKDRQIEGLNIEQQAQIEALIEQVDAWKPDAGNVAADRLARRCLTGRGIACGFEVWHTKKYTLYITPGAGVTSDGHVLTERETTHFTHFRKLKDRGNYPLFVKKGAKKTGEAPSLYDAWELVPKQDDEKGCTPLSPQKLLDEPFLIDKIVLALMPEEDDCSKLTYVIMRHTDAIEALQAKKRLDRRLAERPDVDFVFDDDFAPDDETPFEEDLYLALHPVLALKEIPLPRFGFFNNRECSPEELDQTEFPRIDSSKVIYKTYSAIIEDVVRKVDKQMGKVIDHYHALLFPQIQKKDFEQALNRLDEKWTAYKKYSEKTSPSGVEAQCYIQYFYDWARDLLAAYHELRAELQQLIHACCVCDDDDPISWHPRHLLLGLAMRSEHNGLSSPLRHEMQQPPIYNGNAARLEASRLYFRRWFFMVKFFFLPIHIELEKNPLCKDNRDDLSQDEIPDFSVLRITPGKSYLHPISSQSLPFYYVVSPGSQSLHRFWNYRRSKTVSENQLLSYHAHDGDDSYSNLPHAVRPLFYTLDPYDFYRIEGHIGNKKIALHRKYDKDNVPATYDPLSALKYLIQKHNLDFEVVAIPYSDLQKVIEGMPEYTVEGDAATKVWSFARNILGAEHLAGVPKGGTFIMVTEGERVIADFSLPYRLCNIPNDSFPPGN